MCERRVVFMSDYHRNVRISLCRLPIQLARVRPRAVLIGRHAAELAEIKVLRAEHAHCPRRYIRPRFPRFTVSIRHNWVARRAHAWEVPSSHHTNAANHVFAPHTDAAHAYKYSYKYSRMLASMYASSSRQSPPIIRAQGGKAVSCSSPCASISRHE